MDKMSELLNFIKDHYIYLNLEDQVKAEKLIKEVTEPVTMSFDDAPIGARFKYPNDKSGNIWVKINSYPESRFETGRGLIAKWEGNKKYFQQFCSFIDEESGITFDTEIELL